ncbi:menaquinone biosynthetic enzyme MqnA/MqnD family protein [Pseudodesulfovibrio sediminis]|uniref:Chorismate dehydratase n=1 Tax=Pseudodesulfovibrio sediminis TaxID=2810563 RepID=A0ABN6EXJ7_9BACT|nr:menaquinone biosynthesis protein [Pseudodesulfovibrio sediminis]BCS90273.1 chorismate dehydratase [Pseudodesulfovibrio sediminis]
MAIRLGRIGYLNVLPIYHPLESGIIENDFEVVSGPPSKLNILMDEGKLDISAASSIEYARHAEKYYLVPDIAIGSRGPVQSVLLLSRFPVEELEGKTILVSSQTHTSAALLSVLQSQHWNITTDYSIGSASFALQNGDRPDAILAIGDEALNLRYHPEYPHRIDLGEAWRELTGLPFIFGVWLVQRKSWEEHKEKLMDAAKKLIKGKEWGTANMAQICSMAAEKSCMTDEEMSSYFKGLVYDLGPEEKEGMLVFYRHLKESGLIERIPELIFIP